VSERVQEGGGGDQEGGGGAGAAASAAAAGSDAAHLAAVVKQLPAGIVLAEIPGGRILQANDELERILGHGLLESPDVSEYGQWGAIHADGTPYAPEDHPLARAVSEGEVIENEEVLYRRPDGEVRVLSVSAAPIQDAKGRARAAVATFIDSSDRKRAEEAQALLAEAGRVLVSSLDVRETLQSTVKLGADTLADLAMVYLRGPGGGVRLAVAHRDPEIVRRLGGAASERRLPPDHPALEVMRSGRPIEQMPVTEEIVASMALDAEHAAVFEALGVTGVLMVPMPGRERVEGAFGFMVTRRGRRIDPLVCATAEELGRLAGLAVENARLYEEARAAARLREEFLAVVSHDLRNPLSVIDLATRGLALGGPEGDIDPRRLERALDLTGGAVARMKRLIEDLLDVEAIASASFTVDTRPEAVGEIVAESVVTHQMVADQASVSLVARRVSDAEALTVACDRGRILQVIGNLLDNAIKYTPAGGVVEVDCARDADGVRVTVSDAGQGVPPEDRERIFERFYQQDPRRPGTGLGLSIARGIVEAHGGRIWVEGRDDGPGAVFAFWLPLAG
jgi:PAS domain S-box-containing protein